MGTGFFYAPFLQKTKHRTKIVTPKGNYQSKPVSFKTTINNHHSTIFKMKTIQFFSLLLATSFLVSCNMNAQNWGSGIKGEGPKVTKTLDVSAFDGLGLTISADVYLTQGNTQSVKIEAQQNIIDNLVTDVENGYWRIKYDKNVQNSGDVKIWITVPTLKKIGLSGSGDIIGETAFKNLGDLDLSVSGSGGIKLDANSTALEVGISGSGDMKLAGTTGNCNVKISGSGGVEAFDLAAKTCNVRISGSGDANVNVSDNLEVAIAGSGDVVYEGSPKVKSKISGSGDVSSR